MDQNQLHFDINNIILPALDDMDAFIAIKSNDKKIIYKNHSFNKLLSNKIYHQKCFQIHCQKKKTCEKCPVTAFINDSNLNHFYHEIEINGQIFKIKSSRYKYDDIWYVFQFIEKIPIEKQRINSVTNELDSSDKNITNKKYLEDIIAFLKNTHNFSSFAVSLFDEKGNIIFVNDSLANLIGGTKEQIFTQNFHEIESWKKSGIYERAIYALKNNKCQDEIVNINTTYDKQLFLHFFFIPILNNNLMVMIYNLSKLKEVENLLVESELKQTNMFNLLRTIFDSVNAMIYVADMDTYEVLYINKYTKEIFGDITGKICYKFLQKDQTTPCQFCTNKYLIDSNGKSTGIYEWEFKNTTNNRWYYISDQTIKWHDGRIVRMEIATDITKLKSAEEKLRHSEEKFRLIFEQNFDAIFWADTKTGRFINCNQAAEKLLERSRDEIIGQSQTILHPPDKIEKYKKSFKEAIESKGGAQFDLELITSNGKIKYAQCCSTLIQFDDSVIIQGVFIDTTDKVLTELKLKETTSQLIQAEKLSSLGGLTAGIAHEMSQPLNVIDIIAQKIVRKLRRNKIDNDTLKTELKNISGQVNKMAVIVDQMRIYARKTDSLYKESIYVSKLVTNSFIFMEEQLRVHGIDVIKNLKNAEFKIFVDHIRLEQVLINVIINARYAVEKSSKKIKQIEVGAYKSDDQAVIYIKDNGIGIPDNVKDKIFDPFFTTKDVGQGTGLGLHIAHRIIEEHNGRIEFISEENKGTEFKIFLPKK